MTEPNPYAAPRSRPPARPAGGRFGPIRVALRAIAVVWGFSLLAAPHRPPANAETFDPQPFAKAFGALLLLAAFFPFGETPGPHKTRVVGASPEDL